MERLLVTGGNGFIGSNFIHKYIHHKNVDRIVNIDMLSHSNASHNFLSSLKKNRKYRFLKLDISDSDHIELIQEILVKESIDSVVHFAAHSHVDTSIRNPTAFLKNNIFGTVNLMTSCRKAWVNGDIHKFINISTDEVFGDLALDDTTVFEEDFAFLPNSPYSASKASSDLFCRAYHKTYGFPVITTHCSNNYGPYQHIEKLIPKTIYNCIKEKPIPVYGEGANMRDWIHVDDHNSAIWKIINKGMVGETYNIGGSHVISNLELVYLICDIYDKMHNNPPYHSRKLIEFVTDRLGHDLKYAVNSAKTRRLGWKTKKTFETGLTETIRWYMLHHGIFKGDKEVPHFR